jgi:ADP-ribose pyrophosphatase YjhB (NUDIX family)
MENGETTAEGAARETWEEARAKVTEQQLYRVFDMPQINQVYMFYRTGVADGTYAAGPESTEVGLFAEEDIPWTELAFKPVYETLKEFFVDRQSETYPVRVSKLVR